MFLAKGAAHGKALGWECAQRAVQRPAKRRVLGVGVREARDRSGRSESYKLQGLSRCVVSKLHAECLSYCWSQSRNLKIKAGL